MNHQRGLATLSGAILGTACALLLMGAEGNASDHRGAYTEEFHQTYTLSPGGRLDLANINGAVHITGWDNNQVKVDAVKYAGTKERLDEAKIRVSAGSDYISIHTEYPDRTQTFTDDDSNNPATVEYTLMVPRSARLDEVKLINGSLDIAGVDGEVRASSINGHLQAKQLSGRVKLSTINGRLDADFARLPNSPIELSSVNGSLQLTLPSDAKAEIEASTVHGGIENDFGMTTHDRHYVGHDLHGELGGGGTRIEMRNVNGRIEIRHAGDNRAISPARDLGEERASDRDKDNDDDDDNL
jgi:DUF4097 and DUF4098 domain-containing protein YvlB